MSAAVATPSRPLLQDRRNPRVWIIATALLIVLAAGGLVMRQIATRPNPIHIAFANSLSGAVASEGAESRAAAQFQGDGIPPSLGTQFLDSRVGRQPDLRLWFSPSLVLRHQ